MSKVEAAVNTLRWGFKEFSTMHAKVKPNDEVVHCIFMWVFSSRLVKDLFIVHVEVTSNLEWWRSTLYRIVLTVYSSKTVVLLCNVLFSAYLLFWLHYTWTTAWMAWHIVLPLSHWKWRNCLAEQICTGEPQLSRPCLFGPIFFHEYQLVTFKTLKMPFLETMHWNSSLKWMNFSSCSR